MLRRLADYENAIIIDGPVGHLEAVLGKPQAITSAQIPLTFGVVSHPHPQHGGTMDNKVVTTLSRALHHLGLHTVRFNYRGVGHSEGSYDEGIGEVDDALSVIAWIHAHYPNARIALAGFSFGAYISLRIATTANPPPLFLVTVAPVVTHPAFEELGVVPCPWLALVGDEDKLVSADAVAAWTKANNSQREFFVFENCSHFFHGKLAKLQETLITRLVDFL